MSLRSRVVLAVALTVGFYALALGLLAAMVWVLFQPNVPFQVWGFCLLGAGIIIVSIFPWPRRFIPPGPQLNPAGQARLFAELQNVAHAVGESMPAEVYVTPDMNAGVLQRRRRRVMVIGLPLMQVLTVNQMRAVLAHEFGHYHGGDTRLGPFIYRTRQAIERVVSRSRQSAILQMPFLLYGRMFLRVTQAVSRRQELTADALAARTFGAQAMIDGLQALARGSVAWTAYWRTEVMPLLEAGYEPPIVDGFHRFINEPEMWRKSHETAVQMVAREKTNPYDSHPPDSERIAALRAMPPGPAEAGGPAAASLVERLDLIEPILLAGLLRPGVQMQRIRWEDTGTVALLPGLRNRVARQAEMLRGYTAGWLPELLQYADRLGFSEAGMAARQVTAEQARSLGIGLAGAALTVAMADYGWAPESMPGRPVVVRRDGQSIEPFNEVNRIAGGEVDAEAWRRRCAELGIRDLRLSAA